MRYVVIVVVILAGIAVNLWVHFTGMEPEITIVESRIVIKVDSTKVDSVLYAEGKITFCIDSIVNKQIYLTHVETSDTIVLRTGDIFQITHTVWGKPK